MKKPDTITKILENIGSAYNIPDKGLGKFLNSEHFHEYLCINGSFFYFVIDVPKLQCQYVSPGIKYVLGYQPSLFIEKGAYFLTDICHPDIVITQKSIHDECDKFLSEQPIRSRSNYKFSYDFMAKDARGNYVRLLQHIRYLKFDKSGNALQMLAVCIRIPNCRNEIKHSLLISKINQNGDSPIFKKDFYPQFENGILTKTEAMIWGLISDGHTGKEIAKKLNITINTANTHRKNIYRKLRTISS